MANAYLIHGADLVTMQVGAPVLGAHDVLVRDGRIAQIGPRLVADDARSVDARGCVVAPGFVDTHRHLWQTTLRGLLPNCTLGEYFGRVMIGSGPRVTPQDVYLATLLGSWELLNAGVTSVVDWANATNTPEHADAGVAALKEARIRATYAYGWPGGAEYLIDSRLPHPADARRMAEEIGGATSESTHPRLGFALALRGPASTPADVVRADWSLARELGARITVHTGMRIGGQDRHDIAALAELGLLGADTTYVHCNSSSDDELRQVRDAGGTVSVSAYCESVMGHGRPPTARMLALGLVPSLSADVGVTVPGDMFSHMRATFTSTREHQLATAGAPPDVDPVTVEDVLAMATRAGAAAMGNAGSTGTLEVGKEADLVVVRADDVNTMLCDDPIAMLVGHADTSNVEAVLVGGELVKSEGRLLGADLDGLRAAATESRRRILRA